ncbi:hypothetical protein PMKS-001420 [Pichia membranifaciens]|uniref:DH domain-containing protein n=1 Tax=Pichia membranifaciens TaxID=4926 RepID=A0A1Q2YEG9_9ASCO|nr:hypothetical protein PMKS-001420 [Pichia membranifaciens]
MPSYVTTPLFSIQEAVNSATSLPQAPNILPDVTLAPRVLPGRSNDGNELVSLVEKYRKSEREYLMELQVLESIIKSFDPVYNNYFDSSLEDITNEMVKERKEKNLKLQALVRKMLLKHQQLDRMLHLSDYHSMLVRISEWGIDVNRLYLEYLQYYKLDINQPKTEVKTRRRPLIRIRYLNNFIKSLKSVIIQLEEQPYSAELLSNIEVIIFKLSECLEHARTLDESERKKWENYVHVSSAKDIVLLRSVCVNMGQECFNFVSHICHLRYSNKSQKAALDFPNIEIQFITNSQNKSIAIIQKDFSGKNLLFAPIKQKELSYVKTTSNADGESLHFNHSLMNDGVELCFTFDPTKDPALEKKLIQLFPQSTNTAALKPLTLGLGISIQDGTQPKQEPVTIHQDYERSVKAMNVPAPIITDEFEEVDLENISPVKSNKSDLVIPPRRSASVPLSQLKYSSNMSNVSVSKYLNSLASTKEAPSSSIAKTKEKQEQLSREMLHRIVHDESSDEESILSVTEGLNFLPIDKMPTPPKEESVADGVVKQSVSFSSLAPTTLTLSSASSSVPVLALAPAPTPTPTSVSASTSISEMKQKSINVEKYQHSLQPFTTERKKTKHQSIFGSLTSFLSKKSSKKSAIVPQQLENNLIKPRQISPTKSVHSITSAVGDKSTDQNLINILSDSSCITRQLPNAKVSLWSRNSWTKVKDVKLAVHSINGDKDFYLGVYDTMQKSASNNTISSISASSSGFKDKESLPVLLLKLTSSTDCMFNTIDIHVKTTNHRNESLTVLIRPSNSFGMKIIGNALVCPDAIDLVMSSSSCDSELSKNSELTRGTSISSIESEMTVEEPTKEEMHKSWSGMGSIKLMEASGRLKDLNRCVFSIDKKHDEKVLIDLTGFDFGNIELRVSKEQIKEVSDMQVMVKGERSYVLTFDSNEDVEMFYECVY